MVLILFDGVLQVHKLFALLNLSHAYVTTLGRLVGVVALKEVRRDHADSRVIFLWPWKMVLLSVWYLFYQPMDEKIKTWPLRFPAKENPNMEKAFFDWPIVLQYDVKAKYWLNSRKFFGHEVSSAKLSLNQPKAMRVCICSMYQSNHYISVCLLFLFCLRVFIKRSYKNRSIRIVTLTYWLLYATSIYMKSPCKYLFKNILLINTEFLNFHFEFFQELLNIRDPYEGINIPFCLFLDVHSDKTLLLLFEV